MRLLYLGKHLTILFPIYGHTFIFLALFNTTCTFKTMLNNARNIFQTQPLCDITSYCSPFANQQPWIGQWPDSVSSAHRIRASDWFVLNRGGGSLLSTNSKRIRAFIIINYSASPRRIALARVDACAGYYTNFLFMIIYKRIFTEFMT